MTVSPFIAVDGWEPDLDLEDILHNIFLGHGRPAVGTAIGELLEEGTVPPCSGDPTESVEHLDNEHASPASSAASAVGGARF